MQAVIQPSIQGAKVVDVQKGLSLLGLDSLPPECYPHPTHVKKFADAISSFEKVLGIKNVFIAPSSLDASWFNDEEVTRLGLTRSGEGDPASAPFEKIADAFIEIKGGGVP